MNRIFFTAVIFSFCISISSCSKHISPEIELSPLAEHLVDSFIDVFYTHEENVAIILEGFTEQDYVYLTIMDYSHIEIFSGTSHGCIKHKDATLYIMNDSWGDFFWCAHGDSTILNNDNPSFNDTPLWEITIAKKDTTLHRAITEYGELPSKKTINTWIEENINYHKTRHVQTN